MNTKFPVTHTECGQVAFYFRRALEPLELIRAEDIEWLDGRRATYGEKIICGACGKNLWYPRLDGRGEYVVDTFRGGK